ncbi:universal stress protein [Kitasatospora sp. CB02891]|uniref:universal stress protein n=1 Tax=Kitasatospora sp. CB02891 TaxID=2020329 RepID=UPI0018E21327|nr:universal stress protein [Kitasatospora sp. CB02891]
MCDSVVAGVDGSAESAAAARWAAADALRRGVALRLVTVVSPSGSAFGHREPAGHRLPEFATTLRAELVHALPGLDVSCEAIPGEPWSVLAAAGEKQWLLVLGSRGSGRLAGRLLGSVALRTAAEARCPVVLVPEGAADPDGSGEVVVGASGERPSGAVLGFAFEEAARRGAVLRALEGGAEPHGPLRTDAPIGPAEVRRSLVEARTVRLQDALAPWQEKFPEVRTVAEVTGWGASRALLEASRGAALVVLGRRAPAHPLAAPHLGHLAHAVVHHAHGPVAVVPHDAAQGR